MSDYDPVRYQDTRNEGGPPPSTGLAVGSLITGIIALVLSLIPFIGFISWILAPAGLIMASSRSTSRRARVWLSAASSPRPSP